MALHLTSAGGRALRALPLALAGECLYVGQRYEFQTAGDIARYSRTTARPCSMAASRESSHPLSALPERVSRSPVRAAASESEGASARFRRAVSLHPPAQGRVSASRPGTLSHAAAARPRTFLLLEHLTAPREPGASSGPAGHRSRPLAPGRACPHRVPLSCYRCQDRTQP